MSKQAYISMTGVQTLEQAQALKAKLSFSKDAFASHRAVIGILTEPATFDKKAVGAKQPDFHTLPNILATLKPVADTAIHYTTTTPEHLTQEIMQGITPLYETGLVTIIQYNNAKPDPRQLEQIKHAFPKLEQVIAVTPEMYSQPRWRDNKAFINDYRGLIDHIIIDPSSGTGTAFDLYQSLRWHLTIKEHLDVTTCFAGGLGPETITTRIQELGASLPCMDAISFDAEKELQYKKGAFNPKTLRSKKGDFSPEKATTYFMRGQAALQAHESRYQNKR